jgi:hypothetical protein
MITMNYKLITNADSKEKLKHLLLSHRQAAKEEEFILREI